MCPKKHVAQKGHPATAATSRLTKKVAFKPTRLHMCDFHHTAAVPGACWSTPSSKGQKVVGDQALPAALPAVERQFKDGLFGTPPQHQVWVKDPC